jgi:hypothetical protein
MILAIALAVAGGAGVDRQWMKLSGKYTTEDFRRDHAACSKSGTLNDACMQDRGWVAVSPSGKAETPKDPLARDVGVPSSRPRGY